MMKDKNIFDVRKIFLTHIYSRKLQMLHIMKRIPNGEEAGPVYFHLPVPYTRGPHCQKRGARKRQDLQISIIDSINLVGWDVEY